MSSIKQKSGKCKDCPKTAPLTAGRCHTCYWKHRASVKEAKTGKRLEIKPVSKNRQAALATYRKRRDKYFKENPVCEFPGCISRDITLHHSRGRVGSFLTDKRYFKSLCWPHHKFCEENPEEAKKLNLSQSRL